jgi:hypothetical protein
MAVKKFKHRTGTVIVTKYNDEIKIHKPKKMTEEELKQFKRVHAQEIENIGKTY